jgi:hypothetical protein
VVKVVREDGCEITIEIVSVLGCTVVVGIVFNGEEREREREVLQGSCTVSPPGISKTAFAASKIHCC